MNTQTSLTRYRTYSRLGRLQKKHRVRYTLRFAPPRRAMFEIDAGEAGRRARAAVGASQRQAGLLFRFLYENAVPPEHLRDMLEDLRGQL